MSDEKVVWNEARTWTFGTEKIRRTIEYDNINGIKTVSFVNVTTGHDYVSKGQASQEFMIMIDGDMVSGSDAELLLRDVRNNNSAYCSSTTFELLRHGLAVELTYIFYKDMPVIRKSIRLHNTTTDRNFEIGGLFASENMSLTLSKDMKVGWVNGITDPFSPNVFSYLDYSLEERKIEPGIDRIFTNQVPRDMSYMQQWRSGKKPSINHSNYSYFPWMTIWDTNNREGMFLGLEWSGPWRMELSPSSDSFRLAVSYGNDFRHILGPGETIDGIDLFEGVFTGGVEEAGIVTQHFVELHLTALSSRMSADEPIAEPFSMPPACWNSWFSFGILNKSNINEDIIRRQADEAAKLGFEAFIIDYGWSLSAGDRREDLERFPSGIKKVSEYVRSLGMKFGLWISITPFEADLAETKDPDEWFVRTEDGAVHNEENISYTCACLASGYKQYIKNELDRIITEYSVEWFKFDQNMFFECHAKGHEHQNSSDSVYFQVKAFYEILDYLLKKHPGLFIECALSGALILDYGVLQRTHTAYLHDDFRNYSVRRFFYGASYPLPPRFCNTITVLPSRNQDASAGDLLDRKDTASRRHFFDYFYRTSIMGAFIIYDDLEKILPEARESLARAIELYKNVRKLIKGPVRHILPQPRDPREWDAIEIYDEQQHEGMVLVFRPSSLLTEMKIKLLDLDKDIRYQVYSENQNKVIAVSSGRELMEKGLKVCIKETSGSEIIRFGVNLTDIN